MLCLLLLNFIHLLMKVNFEKKKKKWNKNEKIIEKELNEEWMNGKINENINYSINSSSFEEEPPLLEGFKKFFL